MVTNRDHVLNNPVWNSLLTVHRPLAMGPQTIKRYPPNILQVFGCEDPGSSNLGEIEPWLGQEKIHMVGDLAPLPAHWKLESTLPCIQMVCNRPAKPAYKMQGDILALAASDHPEMLELVNMTQPGYFQKDTPLLGDYFGVRINQQLVAMAGERLRMTGFTEVSAVVTHPSSTGQGFAQNLVNHIVRKNLDAGIVPFLQFAAANERAGKIYEMLGFKKRRDITFWRLSAPPDGIAS